MKLLTIITGLLTLLLYGFPNSTKDNDSSPKSVMCPITVDAGPDITICDPNQTVTLFGSVLGDYLDVEWTPTTGLSNPNSPITDATVSTTTTYTLTASAFTGGNIISNSNFDAGFSDFTSDYIPGTGGAFGLLSNEGQFAIATNAADTHTNFAPCTDHTGGGSMLVVNGAGTPNQDVWCQTVPVMAGTDYAFSAWIASVISASPAQLQFSVNGTLIGGIFTASGTTCVWNEFTAIWNSGGSTSAEICIVNQNTAASGNDFAIDDISFGEICEEMDQVTITVIELDASFTPPTGLCPLSPIIDLNTLLTPFSTPGGMWTINGNPAIFLDPFTLGPGLHSISYTVNNPPCSETETHNIFIEPLPDPSWIVPDICLGTPVFNLNDLLLGTAEPGGTWTVDGIQSVFFDPLVLGVGPHLVSYSVGMPPCVNSLEQFIEIDPLPDASWTAPQNLCTTSAAFNLNNLLDPGADGGGTWTVNGTQVGTFDPATLGEGAHSVIYSIGNFPCSNQLLQFINVESPPPIPMPVCGPITSSTIFFVWPDLPNVVSYSVNVLTTQQGTLVMNTFSVTDLMPGEEVQIQVTANFNGPCGSSVSDVISCTTLSCVAPDIEIIAIDSICLDNSIAPFDLEYTVDGDDTGTATWSGTGIVDPINGTFDHIFAGPGLHTITLTYDRDNCTATATHDIQVNDIPTSDFIVTSPVCLSDTVMVTYTGTGDSTAQYNWNFDGATIIEGEEQGPYLLTWPLSDTYEITLSVEQAGCLGPESSETVVIDAELLAPTINCSTTDAEILFFWDTVALASSYQVNILVGPMGSFTSDTSYLVTGLNAGDAVTIELTIESSNSCDDLVIEHTCVAEDCPDIMIDILPVTAICLTDSLIYDLSASIDGGSGNGDGEWSGPGIIDTDTGLFDPIDAGPGLHQIIYTYTESANCVYSANINIEIPNVPIASFTAPDTICIENFADILFDGTAPNDATFQWDFDGGNINSGMDQGPYEISWDTPGLKTISLTVIDNGCSSIPFSLDILVEPAIEMPIIQCEPALTSILFTWQDLMDTDGYQVNVIEGPPGTLLTNTSYEITGLDPEQNITIEVIALSNNSCPSNSSQITCSTLPCPDVSINIDPVDPICFDGNNPPIDLGFMVIGDSTGAVVNWSGDGIIDTQEGIWQPSSDMIGQDNWVELTMTQEVCITTVSINLTVFQQPEATFTLDSIICIDEEAEINFTGIANPDATFNWDFDGANAIPGTGVGPHSLSWPQAGTYTLSLEIEDNSCTATSIPVNIIVDPILEAPEISCTATFTSVSFSWLDVANADDYTVTVLSGHTGMMTGTSGFQIDNLQPGEAVEIEVTVNSNNACPSSSSTLMCSSLPCPDVELNIIEVDPICFEQSLGPINLNHTISGDGPNGTLIWSGLGITDPTNGIWQVTDGMIGLENWIYLTYSEDICSYTDSILIEVNAIPVADFDFTPVICEEETTTIDFTGIAQIDANYLWSFEGASPATADGPGPHDISWMQAGNFDISLSIEQNGCSSETIIQGITVDPMLEVPQISCNSDFNEILIEWDDVTNANDYTIIISNDTIAESQTSTSTSYTIDGLADNTPIDIELIVNSSNQCPSISVPLSCSTIPCPEASLSIESVNAICEGDATNLVFNFSGNTGPFDVIMMANNEELQLNGISNGHLETLMLDETTDFSIVSVTNQAAIVCPVVLPTDFTITVNTIVNAGIASAPLDLCSGLDTFILLSDLLLDADPNGFWTEVSAILSTNGAFDANAGLFLPSDQEAGTYIFRYTVEAIAPCEDDFEELTIVIEQTPVADAGEDMTIDCVMDMVSIGGSNTSTGVGIEYNWTASGGNAIEGSNLSITDVIIPDTYTLEVINTTNGCSATDAMLVDSDVSVLNPNVSVNPISCFEANDGLINVNSVDGGAPPYSYALNGGAFSNQSFFSNLIPGTYVLTIRDSKGCETILEFDFDEPEELQVRLIDNLEGDEQLVQLGDSVILTALVNIPNESVDTLIWFPDSLNCPSCFNQTVAPQVTSSYSVMVIDENGCTDSDNTTLFVAKERDVYIPNGFSPNNDGLNDVAMIFAGQEVEQINTFQIFNRWGEIVFEVYDFLPNDPQYGWNGIFNGRPMNPAVFVYYVEIKFIDNQVEIFKGDISLLR